MNTFLKFTLEELSNYLLLLQCYDSKESELIKKIESEIREQVTFNEGEIKKYSFYLIKKNNFYANNKNKKDLYFILNDSTDCNIKLICYKILSLFYFIDYYFSKDKTIEDNYSNFLRIKNIIIKNYIGDKNGCK